MILLWVPVYVCWAGAWHLTMADAPEHPPFWRTCLITVSSFAVNAVTPVVQVGGEPMRAGAVAPWLGGARATSSVVTYYMLHALSNLVTWVAGIALVLVAFPVPLRLVLPLVVVAFVTAALAALLFARQRHGVAVPLFQAIRRAPLLGGLAAPLERHGSSIEEMDARITGFYRRDRGRFVLAFALDLAGRCLATLEYWFVARGLGLPVGLLEAFVIGSFGALAVNVIFFVPLAMGVREGSLYGLFHLLGLDAELGVFTALVQRLRELTWIGIGLLVLALAGDLGVERGGVTVLPESPSD